jgi:hypothetical protein
MPDSTANGFPYALPTDPLVQWPATSQSLAEALPKIQSGFINTGHVCQPGESHVFDVTFPEAFAEIPHIVGNAYSDQLGTVSWGAVQHNVASCRFTANLGSAAIAAVAWIAVAP